MSNPTRQETINTHETVNVLPPESQPTMAEIKWDDNKHCLAEAIHEYRGRVVMLTVTKNCGIKCRKKGGSHVFIVPPYFLTPTGKRYTLTEV